MYFKSKIHSMWLRLRLHFEYNQDSLNNIDMVYELLLINNK